MVFSESISFPLSQIRCPNVNVYGTIYRLLSAVKLMYVRIPYLTDEILDSARNKLESGFEGLCVNQRDKLMQACQRVFKAQIVKNCES